MKYLLTLLFSIFFYATAMAGQTVDLDSLPPDLKAQVQKSAASTPSTSAAEGVLREIRLMGESLGAGVAAAAERLGVAANAFLNTGMGKLIAGLLLMKFFGGMVLKTIYILFGWVLILYFLKKAMAHAGYTKPEPSNYEVKQVPVLFGFWTINKRIPTGFIAPRKDAENPGTILYSFAAALSFVAWAICFTNY